MPRPKKYDWSDKKDICHRLYVEEKRPTREVVKYFSEALGVAKEDLPPQVNICPYRSPYSSRQQYIADIMQHQYLQPPVQGMGVPVPSTHHHA